MKYTHAVKLWQNWLLRKIPGTDMFEVVEEFVWYIDRMNKTNPIVIKPWFITDFWSIPRYMWWYLDKTKFIAYILHDFLYKNWLLNRYTCDSILIEAMDIEWANTSEKILVFLWVRVWWSKYYSKKQVW